MSYSGSSSIRLRMLLMLAYLYRNNMPLKKQTRKHRNEKRNDIRELVSMFDTKPNRDKNQCNLRILTFGYKLSFRFIFYLLLSLR